MQTFHSTDAAASLPGSRVAFIQAGWHSEIVNQCRLSFVAEIGRLGHAESDIDFFEVAGDI
jgi:6,7-dimethyl-8-ribityllumazine synthase